MSETLKKLKTLVILLVLLLVTALTMQTTVQAGTRGDPKPPKTTGTIYYTALGDSISAGTDNASLIIGNKYGYPNVLKSLIEKSTRKKVILANRSVPGHDSTDLLNRLYTDSETRLAVSKADIITISIGGNNVLNAGSETGYVNIEDAKAAAGVARFCADLPNIIAAINIINPKQPKILVMNLYNTYHPLEWGSISYSDGSSLEYGYLHDMIYDKYLKIMISAINDAARYNPNVSVVDTYGAFENKSRFSSIRTITNPDGQKIILSPYYAAKKTACTDRYTNFYRYPYRPKNIPFWRDPHPTSSGHSIIANAHLSVFLK